MANETEHIPFHPQGILNDLWVGWLVPPGVLSGPARAIWVYLRAFAWLSGECDPWDEEVARRTGFRVATVRKAIRELQKLGAVEVISQSIALGARAPNLYRLHPDALGILIER
jgi:hypothetical protein